MQEFPSILHPEDHLLDDIDDLKNGNLDFRRIKTIEDNHVSRISLISRSVKEADRNIRCMDDADLALIVASFNSGRYKHVIHHVFGRPTKLWSLLKGLNSRSEDGELPGRPLEDVEIMQTSKCSLTSAGLSDRIEPMLDSQKDDHLLLQGILSLDLSKLLYSLRQLVAYSVDDVPDSSVPLYMPDDEFTASKTSIKKHQSRRTYFLIVSFTQYTFKIKIPKNRNLYAEDISDEQIIYLPYYSDQENYKLYFSLYESIRLKNRCIAKADACINGLLKQSFSEHLFSCFEKSHDSFSWNIIPLIFTSTWDPESSSKHTQINIGLFGKLRKLFSRSNKRYIIKNGVASESLAPYTSTSSIPMETEKCAGKLYKQSQFFGRIVPASWIISQYWKHILLSYLQRDDSSAEALTNNVISRYAMSRLCLIIGLDELFLTLIPDDHQLLKIDQVVLMLTNHVSMYSVERVRKRSRKFNRKLVLHSMETELFAISMPFGQACLLCSHVMLRPKNWHGALWSSVLPFHSMSEATNPAANNSDREFSLLLHIWACLKSFTNSLKDSGNKPRVSKKQQQQPLYLTEKQATKHAVQRFMSFLTYGNYRINSKGSAIILVQDRKTGKLIEEKIPGYIKLALRILHQKGPNVTLELLRNMFKRMTYAHGKKFDSPTSWKMIPKFIKLYRIDLNELLEPNIHNYDTFNAFFYRKLRPEFRLVSDISIETTIVSASDGRMVVFESIEASKKFWIKADQFSINHLTQKLSLPLPINVQEYFDGSSLIINRLAPQDYHRYHSPLSGQLLFYELIKGTYFTVNPIAIRTSLNVFTENTRAIAIFCSTALNCYWMMVFVGANLVGSICPSISVGDFVKKGDELGFFAFGGSTVLTFLPRKLCLRIDRDIYSNSLLSLETLVQMGEKIGTVTPASKAPEAWPSSIQPSGILESIADTSTTAEDSTTTVEIPGDELGRTLSLISQQPMCIFGSLSVETFKSTSVTPDTQGTFEATTAAEDQELLLEGPAESLAIGRRSFIKKAQYNKSGYWSS